MRVSLAVYRGSHSLIVLLRPAALAGSVLTASLLLAGTAVAAIPDGAGVYHGCIKKNDSNIRIIDSATDTCKSNETEITWSKQGPPGANGAPGAAGPTGPSDAYVKNQIGSFGAVAISTTAQTPILTLASLPAGSYVVYATAAISGTSTFAATSCELTTPTTPISSGNQVTTGGGTGFTFAAIPLMGSVTLAAATDISIACRASITNVVSQPSVITAIKVGALH